MRKYYYLPRFNKNLVRNNSQIKYKVQEHPHLEHSNVYHQQEELPRSDYEESESEISTDEDKFYNGRLDSYRRIRGVRNQGYCQANLYRRVSDYCSTYPENDLPEDDLTTNNTCSESTLHRSKSDIPKQFCEIKSYGSDTRDFIISCLQQPHECEHVCPQNRQHKEETSSAHDRDARPKSNPKIFCTKCGRALQCDCCKVHVEPVQAKPQKSVADKCEQICFGEIKKKEEEKVEVVVTYKNSENLVSSSHQSSVSSNGTVSVPKSEQNGNSNLRPKSGDSQRSERRSFIPKKKVTVKEESSGVKSRLPLLRKYSDKNKPCSAPPMKRPPISEGVHDSKEQKRQTKSFKKKEESSEGNKFNKSKKKTEEGVLKGSVVTRKGFDGGVRGDANNGREVKKKEETKGAKDAKLKQVGREKLKKTKGKTKWYEHIKILPAAMPKTTYSFKSHNMYKKHDCKRSDLTVYGLSV